MHMYTSHQGVQFFALLESARCGFLKVDRMETCKGVLTLYTHPVYNYANELVFNHEIRLCQWFKNSNAKIKIMIMYSELWHWLR